MPDITTTTPRAAKPKAQAPQTLVEIQLSTLEKAQQLQALGLLNKKTSTPVTARVGRLGGKVAAVPFIFGDAAGASFDEEMEKLETAKIEREYNKAKTLGLL